MIGAAESFGYGPGDSAREEVFERIAKGLRQGAFYAGPSMTPALEALVAILERIGWRGGVSDFADAMPDRCLDYTVTEMIHTLARLGWRTQEWPLGANKLDPRLLPAALIQPDGSVAVVLGREGPSYGVRLHGGAVEERPASALRGKLLIFAPMDAAAEPDDADRASYLRVLARRFHDPVAFLLWITVLVNALSLVSALAVMAIYDKVIPGGALDTLLALFIGVALAIGVEIALRRVKARAVAQVAGRLDFLI